MNIDISFMQIFDEEDCMEFADELRKAMYDCFRGTKTWDEVNDVIEGWRESAELMQNPEFLRRLDEARKML